MPSRTAYSGVVVGVDGSPSARMAVQWAARDATMRNVPLTLVHAVPTAATNSPDAVWSAAPIAAELREWQEGEARKIIADAIKAVEDSAQGGDCPEINSEVFFSAAAVPTLVDLSNDAQLVVVGCRGQGALRRGLLGSVSTGLVHHAHCPVAVVHNEPSALRSAKLPVLVGIDGSPASESATAIAFDEASRRHVDLVALHAWSDADVSNTPSLRVVSRGRRGRGTPSRTPRRLAGTLPGRHHPPCGGLDSPGP